VSRASRIDRRTFVRRTLGLGTMLTSPWPTHGAQAQAPAIVTSERDVPQITHGVAAGDVQSGRAIVWSRADRASRPLVEYATTDSFRDVRRVQGPAALESSDFTAHVVLRDLPPGQRIFYRVTFQSLEDLRAFSQPVPGSFTTAPAATASSRDLTIAFSADTVGQGWGLNPDWGGLRLYETMRRAQPDVFINLGDTIYADAPIPAEIRLDDGTKWTNVVTEAKSKPAQTLADYRGNYQYNLMDEHMRRFNADVPQLAIWDDHEVRDNWYHARDISADTRYTVKSVALLAAQAQQAFREYHPLPLDGDDPERIYRTVRLGPTVDVFALDLRSYRGANSPNQQTTLDDRSMIVGRPQLAWLKAQLAASRATWKIIASDLPIGIVVADGQDHFEAIANREAGVPSGRELEIADLLRFIKAQRVRNTVWITADVHYCAAHYYNPSSARFADFDPFWEFVAGPLHAGTFGPNPLDATFGPEQRFLGIPSGMKPNRPPSDGLQFFGLLKVDARTRVLTASLHNLSGNAIYRVELPPAR
jgi:alkaline phosphatase D